MGSVIFDGFSHQLPDIDPTETEEWVDSFDAVLDVHGKARACFLLMKLLERANQAQVGFPATVSTPYVNTIPPDQGTLVPGRRGHSSGGSGPTCAGTRRPWWSGPTTFADGIGGHLATFASSASLYEVGFNHFFRGKDATGPGDQVFFQGHATPGIYARAYLEGRLTERQLEHFRMELAGAADGGGCPRTLIPGSCPSSGSSPRCQWA